MFTDAVAFVQGIDMRTLQPITAYEGERERRKTSLIATKRRVIDHLPTAKT